LAFIATFMLFLKKLAQKKGCPATSPLFTMVVDGAAWDAGRCCFFFGMYTRSWRDGSSDQWWYVFGVGRLAASVRGGVGKSFFGNCFLLFFEKLFLFWQKPLFFTIKVWEDFCI